MWQVRPNRTHCVPQFLNLKHPGVMITEKIFICRVRQSLFDNTWIHCRLSIVSTRIVSWRQKKVSNAMRTIHAPAVTVLVRNVPSSAYYRGRGIEVIDLGGCLIYWCRHCLPAALQVLLRIYYTVLKARRVCFVYLNATYKRERTFSLKYILFMILHWLKHLFYL